MTDTNGLSLRGEGHWCSESPKEFGGIVPLGSTKSFESCSALRPGTQGLVPAVSSHAVLGTHPGSTGRDSCDSAMSKLSCGFEHLRVRT